MGLYRAEKPMKKAFWTWVTRGGGEWFSAKFIWPVTAAVQRFGPFSGIFCLDLNQSGSYLQIYTP